MKHKVKFVLLAVLAILSGAAAVYLFYVDTPYLSFKVSNAVSYAVEFLKYLCFAVAFSSAAALPFLDELRGKCHIITSLISVFLSIPLGYIYFCLEKNVFLFESGYLNLGRPVFIIGALICGLIIAGATVLYIFLRKKHPSFTGILFDAFTLLLFMLPSATLVAKIHSLIVWGF